MRPSPRLVAAVLTLSAGAASAYNEFVHHALTGRAYAARKEWMAESLTPPKPDDLATFRAVIWRALSDVPDPGLRAAFVARFPTEASCDAWALKEFLMLNPGATVHGLDPTPHEASAMPRGALLQLASRWPDDDVRNRMRFSRDQKREVLKDPYGQPLPFDPMTLNLGALTGTSSQGHAHYALQDPPLSDDPRVLMNDPAHFAQPKETQAFGGEFAQLYTDIALLARTSGLPAAPWLEATFAGAAFHHIQDAANQIHTLQVGPFVFFKAAIVQTLLRDVATQGGLFGERAGLVALGTRIISNHHLLLEDLFAKRIQEILEGKPPNPDVAAAVRGLDEDDAAFAAEARTKLASMPGSFAHALVKALVLKGGVEGPEAYLKIWTLSAPTLHDGRGYEYDGAKGDDPDRYIELKDKDDPATLKAFYEIEAKGLHRATTAQRIWLESFEAEGKAEGARLRAAQRILALLVPYHQQADARRAAYVPPPPAGKQPVSWVFPILTLLSITGVAFFIRRRIEKARAKA